MPLPLWPEERQRALYAQIGYRWGHPETARFLFDWAHRYSVVACPARASKSYSAAKKALPVVLGRAPRADGAGPQPTTTWIVGPTYELAEKEFNYLWEDLVILGPQRGWPGPIRATNSKAGGDLLIVMPWGSKVVGKSADKPQSLLGEAIDFMVLAEAAQFSSDDIFLRYLDARLATTQGFLVFPTTPSPGAAWLYELFVKGLAGHPDIASYTWPVSGNPIYPLAELERARAHYGASHPHFREQYLGEWVFFEGVVYGHDFDPARNLIEPYDLPPDWLRVRAIDFGYRDPFVCLWAVVTPDGGLDVYREYYETGRAMAEHADALRRLTGDERIQYTVADSSEQQSIADLRRLGLPAIDANRDRRAGRMLVGDYLRSGRLRFVRNACPHTIREISHYRWDKDANREGTKEKTLGDDHAMDALRYLVMSRPRPRVALPPAVVVGSFEHELKKIRQDRLLKLWPSHRRRLAHV